MARKFRPEDLKECKNCGYFFLPNSCPVCNGGEWRWLTYLSDENKLSYFDLCNSSTKKAYKSKL